MVLIDGSKDSLQDRCFWGFIKILGIIGQNKEPAENNFQQPDIFKMIKGLLRKEGRFVFALNTIERLLV